MCDPENETDAAEAKGRMLELRRELQRDGRAREKGKPGVGEEKRAEWREELARLERSHPVLAARLELTDLRSEIKRHRKFYYGEDRPRISDAEYDRLYNRLLEIEDRYPELITKQSPSQTVGHRPSPSFEKVRHLEPMLSLNNAFDEGEVRAFDVRVRKELGGGPVRYSSEMKFDGSAVNLLYVDGELRIGATRGDGVHGEDITESIRTIGSVPGSLGPAGIPGRLEVRGEVVMHTADFLALNERQEELGLKAFVNPRNAAAGNLRNQITRLTASRRMHFYAYGVGRPEQAVPELSSQSGTLRWLRKAGFRVSPRHGTAGDVEGMLRFHAEAEAMRADLPFGIDGVVHKVDDADAQGRLGTISRAPRYAVAHKFDPEVAETTLLKIDVQVGRTGVLTPVARLTPVIVGGVVVSNATLHNESQIRAKGIRVPDRVRIRRAGDVIPEVVEVVPERRPKGARPYAFPEACPSCGTAVERDSDPDAPVIHRCPNGLCEARVCARLLHFASRNALDIRGLGRKIVKALVRRKLALSPPDLFRLTKEDLRSLPKFADLSSENLSSEIRRKRRIPLGRLVFALGIPTVGETAARRIAGFFRDIRRFRDAGPEALLMLEDVGAETARQIAAWWADPGNRSMVEGLLGQGVETTLDDAPPAVPVGIRGFLGAIRQMRAPIPDPAIVRVDGRLPLEDVSGATVERVAEVFGSLAELRAAAEEEIARRLDGSVRSAAVAAARLAGLFRHPHYSALLDRLGEMGAFESEEGPLSGKTVVITGSLEDGLKREEARKDLLALGAKVSSEVTKRTGFLVCGKGATPRKKEQAKALGVTILDTQGLRDLLEKLGKAPPASSGAGPGVAPPAKGASPAASALLPGV